MSAPAEDVVQHLEEEEEMDPENFVTEDDALEVIEMEEVGEHMDDSDEEGAQGEELDQGDDQEEEMDGAEQLLASGFDDSTATYFGHQQPIFSVALHPVDPLIAISGGEDDMGHIWRTDTGETVAQLAGHTDSVTSVGFSFDGEMVATGGMDGLVRVWRRVKGSTDYLSWEFLLQLEGPDEVNVSLFITDAGFGADPTTQWLDWHPKGNLLLCGGADGTVWIWQRSTFRARWRPELTRCSANGAHASRSDGPHHLGYVRSLDARRSADSLPLVAADWPTQGSAFLPVQKIRPSSCGTRAQASRSTSCSRRTAASDSTAASTRSQSTRRAPSPSVVVLREGCERSTWCRGRCWRRWRATRRGAVSRRWPSQTCRSSVPSR